MHRQLPPFLAIVSVLTVLHCIVNPSVRQSIKRVNCDKTKETCAHIHIPYKRFNLFI